MLGFVHGTPVLVQARATAGKARICMATGDGVKNERSIVKSDGKGKRKRMREIFAAAVAAFVFAPMAALAGRSGGRVGGSSFRMHTKAPTHYQMPRESRGSQHIGGPMGSHSSGHTTHIHHHHGGGGWGMFGLFNPYRMVHAGPVYSTASAAASMTAFYALLAVVSVGIIMYKMRPASLRQYSNAGYPSDRVSVAVVKVGMLASAKTFQNEFGRLARNVDTSIKSGLSTLLQEASLCVLRHPSYWTHVSGTSKDEGSMSSAERTFQSLSMSERSKLTEETFTNVDSHRYDNVKRSGLRDEPPAEYVSLSILVAADRDSLGSFPRNAIHNASDLRTALLALSSIPRDSLHGVEIIWSPENSSGSLTKDELLCDHPELVTL